MITGRSLGFVTVNVTINVGVFFISLAFSEKSALVNSIVGQFFVFVLESSV